MNFHRFPNNAAIQKLWVEFLTKQTGIIINLTKHSVLCSLHFTDDYFDKTSIAKVILKKDAVPTVSFGYYERVGIQLSTSIT
jgi:hypothetical protein